MDKDSPVDGDAVRATIEGFHLSVPVIILRSCTTQTALNQLRRRIQADSASFGFTSMGLGMSAATGQVDVTVWPRRAAKVIRDLYGDRVHINVWPIVPT